MHLIQENDVGMRHAWNCQSGAVPIINVTI